MVHERVDGQGTVTCTCKAFIAIRTADSFDPDYWWDLHCWEVLERHALPFARQPSMVNVPTGDRL